MPALLKTTQIQEPSSASVNIQLDSSGNVSLVPTAGNVGIGTTSPSDKFVVYGDGARSTAIASTTAGNTTIEAQVSNYWSATTYTGTALQQYGSTATGTTAGLSNANLGILRFQNGSAGLIYTNGTNPIVFGTTSAERMRITSNGGVSFGSSGTAYGTSGQVLTSAGNAPPTWSTISATGALIRAPQILTSGTSYTTPSNCTAIYVECVGGGGGGAGNFQATAYASGSGGGGGGAYCAKYFTVTGSTAYSYAIAGGGGGGGANNGGSSGGSTTFTVGATTITAGGGSGGGPGGSGSPGGAGGTATNGDFNVRGGGGAGTGYANATNGGLASGAGGTGAGFGGGGGASSPGNAGSGSNGTSAYGYGGGGSGACSAGTTGSYSGGSGFQGVIRIWEFT